MSHYPLLANLNNKSCVVVGGGQVAERKIRSLLPTGAKIVVVSPVVTNEIQLWAEDGKISWLPKRFGRSDIEHASIVIAATDDSDTNMQVFRAVAPHQWINIVDRPDLCSFIVPSVVRRGDLTIAISTQGNYPGLAKKLRQELEHWFGDEYEEYTEFLGEMRRRIQKLPLDRQTKLKIMKVLLEDKFREWTREGNYAERDKAVRDILSVFDNQ